MNREKYVRDQLEALRDQNKPVDRKPGTPDLPSGHPSWHPVQEKEKRLAKKRKKRKKPV